MSAVVGAAYDWLEDRLEDSLDRAVGPDDYPCEPSASLAWRRAVISGNVHRARSLLQQSGRAALDVPRLPDVLPHVVRLGLLQDLLKSGLSRDELTTAQQDRILSTAVLADRAADARLLLNEGFAASHETTHAIRLKGVRSGAWLDVAETMSPST